MEFKKIKEGLRICANDDKTPCVRCPYRDKADCAKKLLLDALDVIKFAEKVISE